MNSVRIIAAGACACLLASAAHAKTGDVFEGSIHWDEPYDGDTFRVGPTKQKIRLWGVDAPESNQPCFTPSQTEESCGALSKDALKAFVGNGSVRCVEKDRSYGRAVAQCTVDGKDLSGFLATNGWAIAYVTYTKTYEQAGIAACNKPTGIWERRFEVPSSYRARGYPTKDLASAIPTKAVRGVAVNSAPCTKQSRL